MKALVLFLLSFFFLTSCNENTPFEVNRELASAQNLGNDVIYNDDNASKEEQKPELLSEQDYLALIEEFKKEEGLKIVKYDENSLLKCFVDENSVRIVTTVDGSDYIRVKGIILEEEKKEQIKIIINELIDKHLFVYNSDDEANSIVHYSVADSSAPYYIDDEFLNRITDGALKPEAEMILKHIDDLCGE